MQVILDSAERDDWLLGSDQTDVGAAYRVRHHPATRFGRLLLYLYGLTTSISDHTATPACAAALQHFNLPQLQHNLFGFVSLFCHLLVLLKWDNTIPVGGSLQWGHSSQNQSAFLHPVSLPGSRSRETGIRWREMPRPSHSRFHERGRSRKAAVL